MASITPYKDGFRASVRRVGYKARTKVFPTKRLAQTWARSVEKEIDEGRYKDPAAGLKTTTVGDLFERFKNEVVPHRKGARWEVVRVNRFLREVEFMHRRLDQFTSADIREWRDERLTEVSKESVRREMNLMGSVFSYAIKEWDVGLKENPMRLVQRPSPNARGRERRWADTEIEAVLKASGWHQQLKPKSGPEYVGWALIIALETAMRIGEICSLKVRDFNPAERCVVLHDTKNGDRRMVPLSKKALAAFHVLTADKKPGLKIVPLLPDSLGLYFRHAREAAGLTNSDLRFHDARHEATTRLSRKLTNVLELSAVTGHRDLHSLKRYYNPTAMELAAKLD